MLYCVSDQWDRCGNVPFTHVEDFVRMCEEVFNETPCLVKQGDVWVDENGKTILEER